MKERMRLTQVFIEFCEIFKSQFWLSWIILGLLKTDQMWNPLKIYLNEDMLIIEVKDISICHCIAKEQLNLLSCQQLFAIRQMNQLEKQYKKRNKKAEIWQRLDLNPFITASSIQSLSFLSCTIIQYFFLFCMQLFIINVHN